MWDKKRRRVISRVCHREITPALSGGRVILGPVIVALFCTALLTISSRRTPRHSSPTSECATDEKLVCNPALNSRSLIFFLSFDFSFPLVFTFLLFTWNSRETLDFGSWTRAFGRVAITLGFSQGRRTF